MHKGNVIDLSGREMITDPLAELLRTGTEQHHAGEVTTIPEHHHQVYQEE